jgi:hypothetical protein
LTTRIAIRQIARFRATIIRQLNELSSQATFAVAGFGRFANLRIIT